MKYKFKRFDIKKLDNFPKIASKILHQTKYLLKKVNFIQCVFDSLFMAIIATLISTMIVEDSNNKRMSDMQMNKLINDLQTVCIGCNKNWMDSAFGEPVFTNRDTMTQEDVYITDIALIRAFFGLEDDSCKMFFITKTSEEPIPFMPTLRNYFYNRTGKELKLGTLSYDQIKYYSDDIFVAYGYFANGSGRTFYGEGYNAEHHYEYVTYYASVDYGEPSSWEIMPDIYQGEFSKDGQTYYKNLLDDFVDDPELMELRYDELNQYCAFLHQRDEYLPNTYGVSSLDTKYTFDKLMDYTTFQSIEVACK